MKLASSGKSSLLIVMGALCGLAAAVTVVIAYGETKPRLSVPTKLQQLKQEVRNLECNPKPHEDVLAGALWNVPKIDSGLKIRLIKPIAEGADKWLTPPQASPRLEDPLSNK